jgi:hypothetical protein
MDVEMGSLFKTFRLPRQEAVVYRLWYRLSGVSVVESLLPALGRDGFMYGVS